MSADSNQSHVICHSNLGSVTVSVREDVESDSVKHYIVSVDFLGVSEVHNFNTVSLLSSYIDSISSVISIIQSSRRVERMPPR